MAAEPTLSVEDQVQTAVAATATVQAEIDIAIDAAVQATVVAMPPTPTPAPAIEYYELSEEELAALIDASVAEALIATETSSTVTAQATSDGVMTEEEIYQTVEYIYDAEAAIHYTEELLAAYYDLYGEYAEDVLNILTAIEEDLDTLVVALEEVDELLQQGAEFASAAIDELNQAASVMTENIAEAHADRQDWLAEVQAGIAERENLLTNLVPTEVANNRIDTIRQVYTYLDSVKAAFGDRKINQNELLEIAQIGANAEASVLRNGGPQLSGIDGLIDGFTRQLARGEWPQARRELGGFEASLPARPGR